MDYYINNKLSRVRRIASKWTITGYSPYTGKFIINLVVHLLAILFTPESLLLI
jgi:hypothetical protein